VKILSDFDKIWCTTADIEPDEIFKALSHYLRCDKVMINEQKTANINEKNLTV